MEKNKPKLKYIPARNKIGAIMRTNDNPGRIDILTQAIDKLFSLKEISLVYIMIYQAKEDGIRQELIKRYGKEKKRIKFINVPSGNFYSDLLNYAINEQTRQGVDYSLILSPEAHLYAEGINFEKMIKAIKGGALAAALKINEYEEAIEHGYFSNAFAIYRNTAVNFVDVWGINNTIRGDKDDKLHFGIEEIYTIKYLIDIYGKGSVVMVTPESGQLVDSADKKSQKWRKNVYNTKLDRTKRMYELLNVDFNKFKTKIVWA
jgi:hypothetical protein